MEGHGLGVCLFHALPGYFSTLNQRVPKEDYRQMYRMVSDHISRVRVPPDYGVGSVAIYKILLAHRESVGRGHYGRNREPYISWGVACDVLAIPVAFL